MQDMFCRFKKAKNRASYSFLSKMLLQAECIDAMGIEKAVQCDASPKKSGLPSN